MVLRLEKQRLRLLFVLVRALRELVCVLLVDVRALVVAARRSISRRLEFVIVVQGCGMGCTVIIGREIYIVP